MTDKLTVYNIALVSGLGEAKLSALTENREPRRVLDLLWDNVTNTCLRRASWKFACRTVQVDSNIAYTTSFGYSKVFDKPTDFMRLVSISLDEFLAVPHTQYRDEGAFWYSDDDPMYVRYVSNDASYGMDLSQWPPDFEMYVAAALAAKSAPRVRESKLEDILKWEKKLFLAAANTDAYHQPTDYPQPGSYVTSRLGGNTRRDRGSRTSLIG